MRNEGMEALVDCALLNKTIRLLTLGDNRSTDRMLKTSVQDLQRLLATRRSNANSGSLPASPRGAAAAPLQQQQQQQQQPERQQQQGAPAPLPPATSLSAEHRFVPRPKRTESLSGAKAGADAGEGPALAAPPAPWLQAVAADCNAAAAAPPRREVPAAGSKASALLPPLLLQAPTRPAPGARSRWTQRRPSQREA
jgi:hypothetical protein